MYAAHWWETAVWNKADELAQALDAAQERRLHPSSFLFLAGAQAWAVLVGFLLPTAINMALDGNLKKILKGCCRFWEYSGCCRWSGCCIF